MNILVLNGSPAGKNSITLYTLLYIQKHFPEHRFEVIHVGQQVRKLEAEPAAWKEKLSAADMIVFLLSGLHLPRPFAASPVH